MDGTPHLLTDVQFSERRRGYDPEEVDNFLERVGTAVAQLQDKLREATARVEAADSKIAEARRAQAAAEAELARAGRESDGDVSIVAMGAASDPEVEAERASRVLLMAQKTADATIEDANLTAQQTIADARERAADLIADAEVDADKLRGDAKREADDLVEQQRATVVRDVKELEDVRTSVQGDVDTLKQHLDEQRSRIRRGVEALALVLDDPEGLRVDEAPELSGASMGDVLAESDVLPEREVDTDTTIDVSDASSADSDQQDESEDEDAVVLLNEGIDVSGVDLTAAPQPSRAPGGVFGAPSFDAQARADSVPGPSAESSNTTAFPVAPTTAPPGGTADIADPDIDLAREEIFAATERDERPAGPATQPFAPFGETEDPLGPADDEADRAMRAFFETDFEATAPPEQKSRFGFRR
jgi:DivIVA domain-containing protein